MKNPWEQPKRVTESQEIQAEKIRLKNLEERFEMDKKLAPDDKEMIKWYETEIKITRRAIEGRPVEGETEEEKEEHKKHMHAMSEEEIARGREKLSKMKQL
jgi:hypothetical protein